MDAFEVAEMSREAPGEGGGGVTCEIGQDSDLLVVGRRFQVSSIQHHVVLTSSEGTSDCRRLPH